MKESNTKEIIGDSEKHLREYETNLNELFVALIMRDEKMIQEYSKKTMKKRETIEKIFRKAQSVQNKYVNVLYETINSKR